jgi:formyltetrahydrofolate deformylase
MPQILRLLISCPDRKGIVYEVTKFIAENNGNIIDSQQHSMGLGDRFFMRLEIDASEFKIPLDKLNDEFQNIAKKFEMEFSFNYHRKNMAILVSKFDHCLHDILQKHKYGEIKANIPVIISNHPDLEHVAKAYGVDYLHCPIAEAEDKNLTKANQEAQILKILEPHNIDFIVMARYMQVLSGSFINRYPGRIINVHHSFLPSFKGANPYHQAYEKGVKVIGATAHYATEDLDMGPIISQDVTPVNFKDDVTNYVSKGRDLEELVFSRAIKAHTDDKIIVFQNRTIVFN